MVCRKLHNEGNRIAGKHLCLLQNDTANDNHNDTGKVHHRSHPPCAAHQEACNQGDNRQLRATGNHGCGHHCHTTVALALNGSGTHDTRNTAAGGNQERNEALS